VILLTAAILVPLLLLGGRPPSGRPSVLFIGDSLTFESRFALKADLRARGFTAQVQAVSGSGLLDTQLSWSARARHLIAADDPDDVVVEFIGNYGLKGAQPGIADATPQFYERWRTAAQQLEDILTSRNAQVYWVIGPPLGLAFNQGKLTTIDRIYASLHAPNVASGRPPTISVVQAFSAPGGGYAAYLPGPGGTLVQMRLADKVHFTEAGIARYADTVGSALERESRG
jgi:hypothetical protein